MRKGFFEGMAKKRKHKAAFLALILCSCFLLDGPLGPVRAYANLDLDTIQGDSDSDLEGDAEVVEEPSSQSGSSSSANSKVQEYENRLESIKDQLDSLAAQKKDIESNLNEARSEKEKEEKARDYLDMQIQTTKSEIELLLERITVYEEQIADKEQGIIDMQAEIDESYAQFKTRLRAISTTDSGTTLGLVLGSADFADFLSKSETLVRIAEHDRDLMKKLNAQRKELERHKAELEETHEQLLLDKEDMEGKKQTLNTQYAAAALRVQDYEEMERAYLADLQKNQAQAKAMEAEIAQLYKLIEWSKNPYVGGAMAWPLPGYSKISSGYGWRFGNKDFHTGMDITGTNVHGASIVAANDGTVKFVNTAYTYGRGYGIYLIIDHGGNMSTLYAHCSAILVSVDQDVKKGQVIAQVGTTGWSTGPHLHFEVRKSNDHVNPYPYVTGGATG